MGKTGFFEMVAFVCEPALVSSSCLLEILFLSKKRATITEQLLFW